MIDANPDARLICIHSHDGTLLLGQAPAAEPSVSAGFLQFQDRWHTATQGRRGGRG